MVCHSLLRWYSLPIFGSQATPGQSILSAFLLPHFVILRIYTVLRVMSIDRCELIMNDESVEQMNINVLPVVEDKGRCQAHARATSRDALILVEVRFRSDNRASRDELWRKARDQVLVYVSRWRFKSSSCLSLKRLMQLSPWSAIPRSALGGLLPLSPPLPVASLEIDRLWFL